MNVAKLADNKLDRKQKNDYLRDLILKIRSGDEEARNQFATDIITIVKPVVSRYHRDYFNRLGAANYIASKIILKIDYIDIDKSIIDYIKFSARNHCIDEYRKAKKPKNSTLLIDNDTLDLLPSPEEKKELFNTDHLDYYNIICNNDTNKASVLYEIEHEKKDVSEVCNKYNITYEKFLDIRQESEVNLRTIKRKLNLSGISV